MAKDIVARQLIKQVPQCTLAIDYTDGTNITINAEFTGSGWQVIAPYGTNVRFLVWRGYIDLGGYTKDELTFFTQAVDIQHGANQSSSPTITGITQHDMVTTRRLRDSECNPYEGFLSYAGINGLDIQEIVYGQWIEYVPYSLTNPSWRPINNSNLGTGNPTASERLHITRIIELTGTGSDNVAYVSSANFLIGGVTGQEKDLVYIERLRRAYTQDPGRNV